MTTGSFKSFEPYKIYIISSLNNCAVTSQVIEFDMRSNADYAFESLCRNNVHGSLIINAIKLYQP